MEIEDKCKYEYKAEQWMKLENFTFSYDGKNALKIPSLSLPVGGIIAIIGKNGAGKSTFSRCLCGLEKAFKGSVQLNGKHLHRKALLKQSYMVMQDVNHQLFCETVKDEIQLGMVEAKSEQLLIVMEHLDLQDLSDRHPMSLSGGQKQRVAIASSILAGKDILLFDEPTSGLDFLHMQQTSEVILGLQGKKTTLIITHDPELICLSCTHVLRIDQGKAVEFYPLNHKGITRLKCFFLCEEEK